MYHHQQACMDLEKATLVMAQLLQGNGVTHDLVVRHQQACLDLDKASRSLIRVLEHEVKKGLGISRSLSEQVEANKQLKMKIDELRKQLEEKDNLLTQANQRLAFLNANPTSRTQSNQVTTAAEVRHAQLNQPVLPAAITPECQGAALSPDTKSSVMPSDVQLLTIKQEDDDAEGDMCKAEPNEVHVTSLEAIAANERLSDGMEENVPLAVNDNQKPVRTRKPSSRAICEAKKSRYSGSRPVASLGCSHNTAWCAAATLTESDLSYINGELYSTKDKVKQDAILLSNLDVTLCKRRGRDVEVDKRRKQRDLSIKYTVLKEDKTRVVICQASFLSIFCVRRARVQRVAKYWFKTGEARPENRGARANDKTVVKKQMVRLHIQALALKGSRYGRRGRKFLPSDLTLTKMYQMFVEQNRQYPVSYSMYWSAFTNHFNLGFGHPVKEVCSLCVKFRKASNDRNLTEEGRQSTLLNHTLHKRTACQYYDVFNNAGSDVFTICFDIMENLVLPKSGATGQTSHWQQLNFYVFGVAHHRGNSEAQSHHDVCLYTWLECENAKDSNVIVSALHHYLTTVAAVDLRQCPNLRLFSDSCHANMTLLSMLFALRSQFFPQLSITHFFPVQGHSFLQIHRVFGKIEQDILKSTNILLPEEYCDLLRNHGTVHRYGKDWRCYDFKKEAATFTTAERSFKISDARVMQICGANLGLKPAFVGEFSQHTVLKPDKTWDSFTPATLPDVNCVKEEKKQDVLKMLCEMGASDAVQEFYKSAMSGDADEDIEQDLEDGDEEDGEEEEEDEEEQMSE